MRTLGKSILALIVIAAGWVAVPNEASADCRVGNCWGAVAIGPRGEWGYVYNFPSRRSAIRGALARCPGRRCSRYLTFHNSCGAYAVGRNGRYGWATSRNRNAARVRALRNCRNATSGCRIRVWACTAQ